MERVCKCGQMIPRSVQIDGRTRNLRYRTSCLTCVPFGQSVYRRKGPGESKADPRVKQKRWRQKTGHSESVKKFRQTRKAALVARLGGGCQLCSYGKTVSALAFHHVRDKEKELSERTFQYSWSKTILPEIVKTVLVCHNCHREIHDGLISEERVLALNEGLRRLVDGWSLDAREPAVTPRSCVYCRGPSWRKHCSRACVQKGQERVEWPEDAELVRLVRMIGQSAAARSVGVSGTALRKRMQSRGILTLRQ